MITHRKPSFFERKNKRRNHFSDRFMVAQLRKLGCTVVPLKWKELNSDYHYNTPLSGTHVILFSQLMCKREASWLVTFGGDTMHNFLEVNMSIVTMIAKPVLTAYIVTHPKWQSWQWIFEEGVKI